MAGQPTPGHVPPPEIAGLMIRAYENPLVSLNKAGVMKPLFPGGVRGARGGWLNSPNGCHPALKFRPEVMPVMPGEESPNIKKGQLLP